MTAPSPTAYDLTNNHPIPGGIAANNVLSGHTATDEQRTAARDLLWAARGNDYRLLTGAELATIYPKRETYEAPFEWVPAEDVLTEALGWIALGVTVFAALMGAAFVLARAAMWMGWW